MAGMTPRIPSRAVDAGDRAAVTVDAVSHAATPMMTARTCYRPIHAQRPDVLMDLDSGGRVASIPAYSRQPIGRCELRSEWFT
jgi:hypothetical protein